MKIRNKILFFILEVISGIGIGVSGALLVLPNKPVHDLNLSIIIGFSLVFIFALIGIGIPGFFHCRVNDRNKNFGFGMAKAAFGILIGTILGVILSSLTYDFLPYRVSSFYIPIFIPILLGVIGFNSGIKNVQQQRL